MLKFSVGVGRLSVDPELMIRSERRLTQEVELHLAYRWFCKLDLEDEIPHHSTFRSTGWDASGTAMSCATSSSGLSGRR
jgi:IS5 family transposase